MLMHMHEPGGARVTGPRNMQILAGGTVARRETDPETESNGDFLVASAKSRRKGWHC